MRKTYDLSITLSNHSIDRVNETVFLGVIIGENLSWKQHIANVARKVSKSLGIILKLSFYLPKSSLITLYYTLIYQYPFYCVNVWGSTYITNLQPIVIFQKRSIRIICKSSFDAHTDPLFKELRILKFMDICRFQIGKIMYQYKAGLLPKCFDNIFLETNQVHGYNTRSSKSFYIFSCRTNIRQFSIRFQGPKFFNSLSNDIKTSISIFSFISKLKSFFFHDTYLLIYCMYQLFFLSHVMDLVFFLCMIVLFSRYT